MASHGGKLCTGLIAQFKALHDKNATDTIEKYIAVSRAGDGVLQIGTSSLPHTACLVLFTVHTLHTHACDYMFVQWTTSLWSWV
jgi:hypothetical protein